MTPKQLVNKTIEYYQSLPEFPTRKQVGNFVISTEELPDKEITLKSRRDSFLTGGPPITVKLSSPIQKTTLREKDQGCWMSTHLSEIAQQVELLKNIRGKVLIGGLGLGIAAHILSKYKKVRHITVVEKEKDVIELVKPYLPNTIDVVEADIFSFIKNLEPNQFTYGYYDIWAGDGERVWTTIVVPLRRLSYGKVKNVICWQEETMLGQVRNVLPSVAIEDEELFRDIPHYWSFRKAYEKYLPEPLIKRGMQPMEMLKMKLEAEQNLADNQDFDFISRIFLYHIGSPLWETTFGTYWDEAANRSSFKEKVAW